MLTKKDIERVSHCRKSLERGFIDLKLIDSILERVELATAPPAPKKKAIRPRDLRTEFADKIKLKFSKMVKS